MQILHQNDQKKEQKVNEVETAIENLKMAEEEQNNKEGVQISNINKKLENNDKYHQILENDQNDLKNGIAKASDEILNLKKIDSE